MTDIWVVNCMEHVFPGMWQRWFRSQCVAVGWPPEDGFRSDDSSKPWVTARNALARMQVGDRVAVALRNRRIGRIGEITGKAVSDDEWNPFVPPGPGYPHGEMGRRIRVRWNLLTGPSDFDLVVQLPRELGLFGRQTVFQKMVRFEDLVYSPAKSDIEQLRGYMKRFKSETGQACRGILVHAGAPKLSPDVEKEALSAPVVEVVNYVVDVNFTRSVGIIRVKSK